MTAHELANELLAGPDLPVMFDDEDDEYEILCVEEEDGVIYLSDEEPEDEGQEAETASEEDQDGGE